MKRKKMGFIILTSIYLLILLIISTSFAWFFINKEVEVDYGTEITCEAGSSLEISMLEDVSDNGEESWSEFSGYVKYNGPSAKIEDITGDGKTLFERATTSSGLGGSYDTSLGVVLGEKDANGKLTVLYYNGEAVSVKITISQNLVEYSDATYTAVDPIVDLGA